jgi:glycerophosphoryl diester phosphodiesterase
LTTILAHRGNTEGPSPDTENGLAAIARSLSHGWGVEIDIRRARDGRFYLSHDPKPSAGAAAADEVCALLRAHPAATVALNVKETGYAEDLLAYLDAQGILGQVFLFDMELIESRAGEMAARFAQLRPDVRVAARVSDRGEPIARALAIETASVIWLDEFDRLWCTEEDVRRLKRAGRAVYAVSPDLHHFSPDDTRRRWTDLSRWGVDGICTDYAAALDTVLAVCGVAA